MSFDKKQQLDSDAIDLVALIKNIWFHKFSLFLFVILSVPASIYFSTTLQPKYKAETVFELARDTGMQGNSTLLNNGAAGFLGLFGGASLGNGASSGSFYSEIRSESLLKNVILNNAKLDDKMLQGICALPAKSPPRFSLRSLLILLKLSEHKIPTESQKTSLLVKCVNEMLEIKLDSPDGSVSTAYRLTITSPDPVFAANLANQIVEKYFASQDKSRDRAFQNVNKYLSGVIAEAQLEFTRANKLKQNFLIKHTLLMNIKGAQSRDGYLPINSPFEAKLNEEISNLSQLEKSLISLKKASLTLSNLKDLNQDKLKLFISSTELQGALSRAFVRSISKIEDFSAGTSSKDQEIKKVVNEELQRLKQQTQLLEDKVNKREKQTQQLMTIENRFQELAIDASKKQILFEALKDQLKEKILTTGLANVEQPVLLTRAVPPFNKSTVSKKMIVVWGVLISFLAGIAFILLRQSFLRRVHSLSQVQKLSEFVSCYEIKYKQLTVDYRRSDKTVISQSFFSSTKEMGKLGCIIDLSQKASNNSLAPMFSKIVSNLLVADSLKIACLDTSQSKKPFSANSQKNFISESGEHDTQGILNKGIFTFNDEDGMISAGEVTKIKNKYADFDKIICSLGDEIGDLEKFNFIEKCDFYILIGRSFHFDEYTYKRFSNTVWEREKKCVGFFLIV